MTGEKLRYNKEELHNPEFLVLSAADKVLFGLLGIRR
jgi:hypothetical protein